MATGVLVIGIEAGHQDPRPAHRDGQVLRGDHPAGTVDHHRRCRRRSPAGRFGRGGDRRRDPGGSGGASWRDLAAALGRQRDQVGGKRAYQLVREGEQVELAAGTVRIERFDVLGIRRDGEFIDVDVEVDCSSGTYVRAGARPRDALGVGGHLIALRRTRVGGYGLDHARTLEQLNDSPA